MADETTSTTTVTHYQQLAAQLNKSLDDFLAAIPSLEPVTPETTAFIRRKRRVSQAVVTAALSSLQVSPQLQAAFSAEEALDHSQFVEAFRPMVMKLRVSTQTVENTVETREAILGAMAQKICAMARSLPLGRGFEAILPHLENMKRAFKRAAKGSKKEETPTVPPVVSTGLDGGKREGGAEAGH